MRVCFFKRTTLIINFQLLLAAAVGCSFFADGFSFPSAISFQGRRGGRIQRLVSHATTTTATTSNTAAAADDDSSTSSFNQVLLKQISAVAQSAKDYATEFGLTESEAGFYGIFDAIRQSGIPLGLQGQPFVLRKEEITTAFAMDESPFAGFYTIDDLAQALEDDFLDAARGSTDNRKGWKITTVSNPRGDSFEEARMTFEDVTAALDKGTVIFNAAGAHIPKLAGPSLACTDATTTPNAINIYVTAAGKRTSAPPHTDKQDVLVVQTSGRKHWKVYAPPDPSLKPLVDIFARGKGEDNMPLYQMDESGGLLLETTLEAGDIMFIPAAFPHTTSTAVNASEQDDTSVHLTFNIDTHVWDLDYLSARRLALRRACVQDSKLGQMRDEDNRYVGKVNQVPIEDHRELMAALPLGFLLDDDESNESPSSSKTVKGASSSVEDVTAELVRIAHQVDPETASVVDASVWKETVERLRQQGMELLEIHRDMYLAALEEGRLREAEDAMTAHLDKGDGAKTTTKRKTMSPQRLQRLSLFRVQRYYEKINAAKASLLEWSYAGTPATAAATTAAAGSGKTGGATISALPENWAFTLPVKVGDQVEADLGGALFPATVTRVGPGGTTFDVQFFDGDKETGLERGMIKLLSPPKLAGEEDEVDTSSMTPKQLKRWKKQQEKKNKK